MAGAGWLTARLAHEKVSARFEIVTDMVNGVGPLLLHVFWS
jgi:hypothetical protein